MAADRLDVLGTLYRAEKLFNEREYPATYARLVESRQRVAELIEAARDCNEWLCRTNRKGTAHQRSLAAALAKVTP